MQNTWARIGLIGLCIIAGLILLALLLAFVFSFRQERRAENKLFVSGHLPSQALTGEYNGNKQSRSDWLGKRFEQGQKGINLFPSGDRYPFTTTNTKSLRSNQEVVRLNYDIKGNPWWLRQIVDEVVEVEPDRYQGKVFVRLGPLVFTLTYFQLSK